MEWGPGICITKYGLPCPLPHAILHRALNSAFKGYWPGRGNAMLIGYGVRQGGPGAICCHLVLTTSPLSGPLSPALQNRGANGTHLAGS